MKSKFYVLLALAPLALPSMALSAGDPTNADTGVTGTATTKPNGTVNSGNGTLNGTAANGSNVNPDGSVTPRSHRHLRRNGSNSRKNSTACWSRARSPLSIPARPIPTAIPLELE